MTDATNDDSKEPVAGLSAASSCIRLSLTSPPSEKGGEEPPPLPSFRPVYTHQSFEGECIAGWRPLPAAERESHEIYRRWSQKDNGEHPSYKRCSVGGPSAGEALDVHVILAPSGASCTVEVRTEKCTSDDVKEPAPKRKKVSFGVETDDAATEEEAPKQLGIPDVVRQIANAVPPIASVSVNGTALQQPDVPVKEANKEAKVDLPIESVLKTYYRKIKGEESAEATKFVMALADGSDPEVAQCHNSIQPLARWFIETADDVDLGDTSKGAWKVLYLFRYHESGRRSLAGYVTLLHVTSPFHKPHPGIIVRICQALILPPYHRAGHGSAMLRCIHEYADGYDAAKSPTGMGIVEVNVEDPAPAFVALRDSVDYRRFLSLCHLSKRGEEDCNVNFDYLSKYNATDKELFLPVPEEALSSVAEALKITKRQVQIVHELYKLEQVLNHWKHNGLPTTASGKELMDRIDTNYRLMVKKSLRTLRIEELGACGGDKEKQKALLQKWFEETTRHYRGLVGFFK